MGAAGSGPAAPEGRLSRRERGNGVGTRSQGVDGRWRSIKKLSWSPEAWGKLDELCGWCGKWVRWGASGGLGRGEREGPGRGGRRGSRRSLGPVSLCPHPLGAHRLLPGVSWPLTASASVACSSTGRKSRGGAPPPPCRLGDNRSPVLEVSRGAREGRGHSSNAPRCSGPRFPGFRTFPKPAPSNRIGGSGESCCPP